MTNIELRLIIVSFFTGFVVIGTAVRIRRIFQWCRYRLRHLRFRKRFPIGSYVRINGKCCERRFTGQVVRVARWQFFGDRPEVRFDLPVDRYVDRPWGCCANGMDPVTAELPREATP